MLNHRHLAAAALGLAALAGGTAYSAPERRDEGRIVAIDREKGHGSGAGAVVGGLLGGVLGHQVGSGRGNTAATVAVKVTD